MSDTANYMQQSVKNRELKNTSIAQEFDILCMHIHAVISNLIFIMASVASSLINSNYSNPVANVPLIDIETKAQWRVIVL